MLLLGAGCATLPEEGPAEGGFHLRGKLGVVQGEESFSARFLWLQEGGRFDIDLWGPLGQGRLNLTGSERLVELREPDGTLISRGTPEAVMRRQLGWSVPLSVLAQWVRGRPARGIPVRGRTHDDAGRLSRFRQLGWQVDLERYRPVEAPSHGEPHAADAEAAAAGAGTEAAAGGGNEALLPYRVTARRDGTRVRLAISEWRIQAH